VNIGGVGVEGILFYAIAWCGWIIETFFMDKSVERTWRAFFILVLIISSCSYITVASLQISASCIFLVVGVLWQLSSKGWWSAFYLILCAGSLGMLYAVFHIIEIYDPVWIVIERTWLLSALLVYIICLIARQTGTRILVLCFGGVLGELLLGIFLYPIGFHQEIGSPGFLDVIACAFASICCIHCVKKCFIYVPLFKQKQVKEG
jgi:hypothetical protein